MRTLLDIYIKIVGFWKRFIKKQIFAISIKFTIIICIFIKYIFIKRKLFIYII